MSALEYGLLADQPALARPVARERGAGLTWPRPALLLAPLLLVMVGQLFFTPTDPDYWWHVRTGQWIVEHGGVPRSDPYSFTAAGQAWHAHEWLTELGLYLVQSRFGYVGNVALFGLVGALTALAVYATCRRRGLGEPAAAIAMFWSWAMMVNIANVRPLALTTLLVAVLALLVTCYRQGQRRALWPIPLLLALWVNLHGGYLIGLVLLGLTVVGEAVSRLVGRSAAPLRPLVVVSLLAGGATLLSPHGLDALAYPFTYAGTDNGSMRFISEWQSPDFHRPDALIFAGSLLLSVALGLWRRPLGPTEALWGLLLGLMALQSTRHLALYAVVVPPLLGARLAAEAPALTHPLAAWQRRRTLLAIVWLLLGLSALKAVTSLPGPEHLQLGREPSNVRYPAGAVAYIRGNGLPGNLFNDYVWGGYLIYQLYPQHPVFIDGRADVHGDAHLERYVRVITLQPGWRQVLDEFEIRAVLTAAGGPLAVVLGDDPAWREVYAGEVERLYVRD